MYRGSSPIFDIPEFPTLRRVKPLPKRRRTSGSTPTTQDMNGVLPLLSPDATAEDLLAHADSLSAQMALQSYYMPMLGSMQELFENDSERRIPGSIDFSVGFGMGDLQGVEQEEENHGEGDYIDHLQQPGNTKKRKVPANASTSPLGADSGVEGEEQTTERSIAVSGKLEQDPVELPSPPSPSMQAQRKGKLSLATLAGLQHKEMLKNRKRQLAAVLGALSHGDTLALDQALSTTYSFTNLGEDVKSIAPTRIRPSRRRVARMARTMRALRDTLSSPGHYSSFVVFPEREFTFVCHSPTSDRLVATKEEVAVLRSRFEAELARQAMIATKAALSKVAATVPARGVRSKRAERRKMTPGVRAGEQVAGNLEQPLPNTKGSGGKKKKRSALANASNPHHLRNYIPSRLPHSGQGNQANTNYITPPPLRFLSAEIPYRRKKSQPAPVAPIISPVDEWVCPRCEYELFYGDEQDYRRAVRNRKKILRRRRRARERAAAAASGNSTIKTPEKTASEQDGGFEVPSDGLSSKWKGGDVNVDPAEKMKGDHSFG